MFLIIKEKKSVASNIWIFKFLSRCITLDDKDLLLSYNRRSNLVGGRGYIQVLYQMITVKYRTWFLLSMIKLFRVVVKVPKYKEKLTVEGPINR
jgi:hypothetical protein